MRMAPKASRRTKRTNMLMSATRKFLLRHPRLLAVVVAVYMDEYRRNYDCTVRVGRDGKSFALRKNRRELWMSLQQSSQIPDAVQRLDHYIDAIEPELIDGIEIGDFRGPRMHMVRGLGEQFKFSSFPEGFQIAKSYLKIFQVTPGDVVIDAGAGCGLTTYLFSKAVGSAGKVVAIEADPRNFECLTSNVNRLQTRNIDVLNATPWGSTGSVYFSSEGSMGPTVLEVSPTKPNRLGVRALTFSDISQELSLSRVDHVKVDIEGAEYEALPAASPFIERYRPDFLVEMHLEDDGPVNVPRLQEFFGKLNYEMRFVPQLGDENFPLVYFWPKNRRQH
jgi:FkbM family methyltransferase